MKEERGYSPWDIMLTTAGLRMTSRQSCWWSRKKKKQKHFSHFGTKPYFHKTYFEKKLFCNDHQHGRFIQVVESQELG